MYKRLLVGLLVLMGLTVQAQNEITIDGKLTNVKDGLIVQLFRRDGRVGTTIATDTIKNGQFHFKVKPENELERLDLYVGSNEFPPMSRNLFVTPKSHIEVIGKDNLILDPDCGLRRAPKDVAFKKLQLMNQIKDKYS